MATFHRVPARSTVAATLLACSLAWATEAGDWRGVRWGMTDDEAVRALGGKARKLPEPVKLADGNVAAVDGPDEEIAGYAFKVVLVFDAAGKLALVSLKSDPAKNLKAEAFDAVRKAIAGQIGRAGVYSSDDNFIDMRQETWKSQRTRVDVKYIPGTVVVMYSAAQPEIPAMLKR